MDVPPIDTAVAVVSAIASCILFVVRGVSISEERMRRHVAEVRAEVNARIDAVEKRTDLTSTEIRADLKRIEAILVSVQIGIAALPRREDPA